MRRGNSGKWISMDDYYCVERSLSIKSVIAVVQDIEGLAYCGIQRA